MSDREVFDLDAVGNEADESPFTFRFGGQLFELPASPDMVAFAALAEGKLYSGLQAMLGPDQWEKMVGTKATFNLDKLTALMEQYTAHIGLSLGKSQASTSSSKSTAGQSRRTSSGTTGSRSRTSIKAV